MPVARNILNGWRVVVIDDEADSLEVATRILVYYGAHVETAQEGLTGVKLVQQSRPHFIVCDLSMPGIDGWQVLRLLKDDQSSMTIPVIALTAHAMPGDRDRAVGAGFHNYLSKPLKPATFIMDLLKLLIDVPDFEPLKHEIEKSYEV